MRWQQTIAAMKKKLRNKNSTIHGFHDWNKLQDHFVFIILLQCKNSTMISKIPNVIILVLVVGSSKPKQIPNAWSGIGILKDVVQGIESQYGVKTFKILTISNFLLKHLQGIPTQTTR